MKIIKCPDGTCEATITVAGFSRGEESASGKHVDCPGCGQLVWMPVGDFPPIIYPHATDQQARPHLRKALLSAEE